MTCRRHGQAQLQRWISDKSVWRQWFRLSDRYGDNGLVAVMIAVPDTRDKDCWEGDTLLMSCRVIGRGLEQYMLAVLLRAAKQRTTKTVIGEYIPAARNQQVAELYPSFGFHPLESSEGVQRFALQVEDASLAVPDYFALIEE